MGAGWREVIKMICPTTKAKYFCEKGWTEVLQNWPTGKSGRMNRSRSCVDVLG